MSTEFRFSIHRTAQAIAILLKRQGGRMSYMRAIKLLYLADRESLREIGYPITGDRFFALERGPILSYTLDLFKADAGCEPEDLRYWQSTFQRQDYEILLACDPGDGELCDYEVRKLEEVSIRFKDYDDWDLVRYTHKYCKEYQKNEPTKGHNKRIPLIDVIEAVGRLASVKEIEQAAKESWYFNSLFIHPPHKCRK